MGAKDSLINLDNFGDFGGISEYYEVIKSSMVEQAEISFKAGMKAGINEVVEWIGTGNFYCYENGLQPVVETSLWQAKLKSWNK